MINANGQSKSLSNYYWNTIEAKGDVVGRHENGFVEFRGKFYLIGGRGINPVNVFDPKTNTWETKAKSPMEIHHFQPVVYKNAIYLLGAMTGGYPIEEPLDCIWKYYPENDTWEKGVEIPQNRRRGAAGAVLYQNKIYISGGIKFGHTSGTTNYFDSYDLETNKWETLTDAPHIRDHFYSVIANDKLYNIGGRITSVHYPNKFNAFFESTISYNDYYDFREGKWYTMQQPLPIPTAAGGIVKMDNHIVYIGGESGKAKAHSETQCLDLTTNQWKQLQELQTPRHGSGVILYNGEVFFAAGSPNRGGGNLNTIEKFTINSNE